MGRRLLGSQAGRAGAASRSLGAGGQDSAGPQVVQTVGDVGEAIGHDLRVGAAIGGVDLASWPFWTWSFPKKALAGSVFENSTSLMIFGIIAGAMLAAGLAGRFRTKLPFSWRPVLAAALGGLAMGYGARLAFGCNIGAYFSGVASGSLHGWLWLVAALAGSYVGGRLRPLFRLPLL